VTVDEDLARMDASTCPRFGRISDGVRIPAETRTRSTRNCAGSLARVCGLIVAERRSMLAFLSSLPLFLSSQSVIGGTPVKPGAWPDAVVVLAQDAACTGTLITPDVVLTAGHCIDTDPVVVIVDTVDYGQPGGEPIRVKAALAYPDWEHAYDVGVVVLEHAASVTPRVVAAACSARSGLTPGAQVHLVGFGLTTRAGTGNNTRLHEAAISIVDPACSDDPACMPAISPGGEFTAGGRGTDACFGDSGGPVYLDTSTGPALVGVVSRAAVMESQPCGDGGVYVRADRVIAWVQRVTHETVARTRCSGAADEDGSSDPDGPADPAARGDAAATSTGCAAADGAGGTLVIALGVLATAELYRRRRRRTAQRSRS
jgi:MYXO-CTERM domain-containing protein